MQNDNDAARDRTCSDNMVSSKLISTLLGPTSVHPMFEPVSNKEGTAQFYNASCVNILRRLSKEVAFPSENNRNGFLCHHVNHDQIVISHTLIQRVLQIHHYARLARRHGAKKPYHSLWSKMDWPVLAVDGHRTIPRCSTCAKIVSDCVKTLNNYSPFQQKRHWSQWKSSYSANWSRPLAVANIHWSSVIGLRNSPGRYSWKRLCFQSGFDISTRMEA